MQRRNGKRSKVEPRKVLVPRRKYGTKRHSLIRRQNEDIANWCKAIDDARLSSSNNNSDAIQDEVVVIEDTLQKEHHGDRADESGTHVPIQDDPEYNIMEQDDDEQCIVGSVSHRTGLYYIDDKLSIRDQLARWAVFFSVPAIAFSAILKILSIYKLVFGLPVDSRTVLKTARNVETKKISGGEYFHFGIAECITQVLNRLNHSMFDKLDPVLDIAIGTDGLPCFKSVNTHVWPILGSLRVNETFGKPFTIGLFYGVDREKNVSEFLSDFVQDFNACYRTGFSCRNRHFTIKLYSFVCDAPARAFVKNVINHNGKHGCERCRVKSVRLGGRCFNDENARLRTNKSVKRMTHARHHKGPTPLSQLDGIKLVSHFVLDYMHLVLLGVVRKLVYLWLEGELRKTKKDYRIVPKTVTVISTRLLTFIETCPKEFSRKPRPLRNFKMYKATEWRTWLLYTGMVALKSLVKPAIYTNFLILVCAMRIYLSTVYATQLEYRQHAKLLMKHYVSSYRTLYGRHNVVYNVHNLIHLHSDCERYGSLDNVSAFQFENHLQSFKHMIRSGSNTIQQLIRRIDEEQRFGVPKNSTFETSKEKHFFQEHDFPLARGMEEYRRDIMSQFKAIDFNGRRYSVFSADSCIRLLDSSVGKIVNIVKMQDNTIFVAYKKYLSRKPFFKYPMNSEDVGISCVRRLDTIIMMIEIGKVRKAWLLPDVSCNSFVAVDLL